MDEQKRIISKAASLMAQLRHQKNPPTKEERSKWGKKGAMKRWGTYHPSASSKEEGAEDASEQQ